MPQVTVDGVTLEYEIQGSGEPVLLIMGLATQMIGWPQPFVDLLVAHGYQVIRFDNRDIGRSSKTDAPPPSRADLIKATVSRRLASSSYVMADMAADTAGLLDHLGIESAHVVGASMGGMIAQELAIGHSRRIRSLTSIMSNTGDRRHGLVAPSLAPKIQASMTTPMPTERTARIERGVEAYRIIAGPHFNEAEVRARVTEALSHSEDTVGRLHQLMAINASPDRTPGLRRLDLPTLVIHGLLDRLIVPSGGMATARAVPGSRLLMFPDMAHDLPGPRFPEMVEAIVTNARRA